MTIGSAMVVEDQYHFRKGLVRMIEDNGRRWQVVGEAGNGLDALDLFQRHRPDLVLTDIRMPAMDGLEFVRRMRMMHPDTLVIILTGYKNFEYAQAAIKLGVMDYLIKPCTEEDVRSVLGKATERFAAVRGYEQQAAIAAMSGDNQSCVIKKAIEYVEIRYAEECRLTEVAQHVHLNPSYFSVLFKKTTGESFTSFVTKYRMEKAMELLRSTDMKIFEVASATGFGEPNYFTNVFKQHYKVSPKECRRRQGK